MNNEPVAWMAINKSTGIGYIQKDKPTKMNKMDNEYTALYEQTPVAWLAIGENTNVFFDKETALAIDENATPLYTHPAKILTNDVVNELWAGSQEDGIAMQHGFTTQQHYFAHLILRKAN